MVTFVVQEKNLTEGAQYFYKKLVASASSNKKEVEKSNKWFQPGKPDFPSFIYSGPYVGGTLSYAV